LSGVCDFFWPAFTAFHQPLGAQGIAAEILFCGAAAKKIGAESPVFCGAKNAPKSLLCEGGLLPESFF
jgi:hypothetical protein